ncbi:MAG TPA: hypothetical protein VKV73_09190 [Chloroflexota bacterium]|nr:hypothetical protein [Chloroflexota bacterium]
MQGTTDADLVAAQTAVDTAQASLSSALAKLDELNRPTPQDLAIARANAESARTALVGAQAKLGQLQAGPTDADLAAAQSAVAGAQATLADKSIGDRSVICTLDQEHVMLVGLLLDAEAKEAHQLAPLADLRRGQALLGWRTTCAGSSRVKLRHHGRRAGR